MTSVPGRPTPDAAPGDVDLVRAAARGEPEALGQLFDRHAGVIHGIALRMLRSPRDAEDLVHDVFLEAWRDAALYDPERGTVRAWLAVRARSRALDRLGRAEVGRLVALDDVCGIPERPHHGAHPADAAALHQALRMIPEDVRVVLEETYFFGSTAREISERLDIPVGTVKSRLARGLGLLREGLGIHGEDQ